MSRPHIIKGERVLTIYRDLELWAPPVVTACGQQIPIVSRLCKLKLPCGCVILARRHFVENQDETQ